MWESDEVKQGPTLAGTHADLLGQATRRPELSRDEEACCRNGETKCLMPGWP